MLRHGLAIALFVLAGFGMLGVLSPPGSRAEEVLHNDTIIQLQGLNLGDSVIIAKIKASKCDFDTSIDGLKGLKAAHVSDEVIRVMITAKDADASRPPAPPGPATGDPNDPATPHAPGVWLLREVDGRKTLTQVVGEPALETSRGGFVGPWGIGKVAETAHLSAHSDLQLTEKRPVFYFYFGQPQPGMMPAAAYYEFYTATGPKDMKLAQFKINVKKSDSSTERVLEVSRNGAYAGSSGVSPKDAREFTAEPVADGIYKIVPKDDLADGEYAFCPPYVQVEHRFYSFGIKSQ